MANNYNLMKLVENQLADIVRSELEERVLEQVVAEFEQNAREIVKKHVNKFSFDAVESMKDMCRVREEVHMYVHYKDDETIEKKLETKQKGGMI